MGRWVWNAAVKLQSRRFKCGHCGEAVACETGYHANEIPGNSVAAYIYICHFCYGPTFFGAGKQIPGGLPGSKVADVADAHVEALFNEARNAFSANAFTAAVLACRKLLMHVAVSRGAGAGESFVHYVDYLADQGFVPPDGRDWVDHIRRKGNEANHEIVIMGRDEAEELIGFSEMLLKFIYEFPAKMKRKLPQPS